MNTRQQIAGGLITEIVSTLTGGVSQQAEAQRQPTQAKEILNCILDPTEGLSKRPPSEIVQNLTPVFSSNIVLAPFTRTTQEATSVLPQINVLYFDLEDEGVKFTITVTTYTASIFGPIGTTYTVTYTVQDTDVTLADLAGSLATAINLVTGAVVGAVAELDDTITLTGASNNALFSVAITRDVLAADTGAISPASIFTHVYNRDLNEKYLLAVANGKLAVVDLVNRTFPTITGASSAYLETDTPGISIRALTIADTTFIVNREKVVDILQEPYPVLSAAAAPTSTNTTTEVVTFAAAKNWLDGVAVQVAATANGLTTGVTYYLHMLTTTTASFHTTRPNAIANTSKVNLTGNITAVVTPNASEQLYRDVPSPTLNPEAIVWVRMGDYSTNYTITVGGVDYTHQTSADARDEIDTGFIATALAALIPQNADNAYSVTVNGSSIRIRRFLSYSGLTYQDFTVKTSDGLGDQAIRAIKGEIQSIEDLPARAVDGFTIKVIGDADTDKDDFYVVYDDGSSVDKDGVWRETLKQGEAISLDPATMPHVLTRNSDGTFTLAEATWDSRLVGDLTSAPFPSFTNFTIDDVMFHKNRLGFVSEQNIVFSQVGEYYNFFRVSVQQLLDEEIIDYAIAATEIAPIRHVVPLQKNMTLWSDREQFVAGGEPLFTAKTVFADRVSGFECSHRVKPTPVGKDIFFASDRNSATKIMEFFSTDSGTTMDAQDMTEQVPSYLKGKPLAIASGQNANAVFIATLTNMNDLYVYNYRWNGNQLVQSAWSTWRFQDGNILAIDFVDNSLLIVIQRGPIVMLEKIDILPADVDNQLQDTPSDHLTHLDLRFGTQDFTDFGVTVAYDAITGRTTWTFAADPDAAVPHNPLYPMKVVSKATPGFDTEELPDIQRPSAGSISALGDWSDTDVWIGLEYEQNVELSRLYAREASEDGMNKAITDSVTQVRNVKLDYTKTGYFLVEVTPEGRSTPYQYEFDGDTNVEEGTIKVPVQSPNDQVRIVIRNQSHRPATFTGMSWDGMFQRRTGK